MHRPPRAFEEAEFAARCAAAQAAMQQAGVAATLLTSEAEIRYFTGFMTQFWQSPTRTMVCRYSAIRQTDCGDPVNRRAVDAAGLC
jgi:Xaa-Pro aminopeptidase